MKTFLLTLSLFAAWFAPVFFCSPSFGLVLGILFPVSFIVFILAMMAREQAMEEKASARKRSERGRQRGKSCKNNTECIIRF